MKAEVRASRRGFLSLAGVGFVTVAVGLGTSPLGCFPPLPAQKPDPCNVQMVTLGIFADEMINPNENEETRPVSIRLYQLTQDTKLQNARYEELLLKDKEVLGDTMLKVDELQIFPNELKEVKFERIPEATILAGVAFFHSPVGQAYKTYYEFPPMPNTPEACAGAGEGGKKDDKAPQAFPETSFFVRGRKLDNGSEFDASMFPKATKFERLNLPKASAERASQQKFSAPGASK